MKGPECHCGTATETPHETGTCGCQRFVVPAPVKVGSHPDLGCDMWITHEDITAITDYTLREQRGYHLHEGGQWTRWNGSSNSLDTD